MQVYVNGRFVSAEQAQLSIFDAAFQHAVGLFETMWAYRGVVYRLAAHLARLARSADELGLSRGLNLAPLAEAIQLTLEKNQLTDARIRLTLTGGDLSLLAAARGEGKRDHTPGLVIQATPPTIYPESFFTDGVSTVLADGRLNPFDPLAGHKTLNYWSRLRSLTQAAAVGAAEALWVSVTGHLCGGAVSNVFLVKNGVLITPPARGEEPQEALPSPVLPGTRRQAVLELAEKHALPVEKRPIELREAFEADEIFLTNSSWLLLPVTQLENRPIGARTPGAVSRQLYENMLDCIEAECRR